MREDSIGKATDVFLSIAKGREEKKVAVAEQGGGEIVYQKSRALSFPRDAHYADGVLPSVYRWDS